MTVISKIFLFLLLIIKYELLAAARQSEEEMIKAYYKERHCKVSIEEICTGFNGEGSLKCLVIIRDPENIRQERLALIRRESKAANYVEHSLIKAKADSIRTTACHI